MASSPNPSPSPGPSPSSSPNPNPSSDHAEEQHDGECIRGPVCPLALAALRLLLLPREQVEEAEGGEGKGVREREGARHLGG